MKEFKIPVGPDPNRFTHRLAELRQRIQGRPPALLAAATGAAWENSGASSGEFHLEHWGRPYSLSYPDWNLRKHPSGEPASQMELALVLYYFDRADGTAIENAWISFSELPDATFYNQAFQGYTGEELRRAFENNLDDFGRAAVSLGGERGLLGDRSYRFKALPRVSILVVYWLGDEDFPPSAQVLFDVSASHYLPTDAYAILGSTITRRLIAARQKS